MFRHVSVCFGVHVSVEYGPVVHYCEICLFVNIGWYYSAVSLCLSFLRVCVYCVCVSCT